MQTPTPTTEGEVLAHESYTAGFFLLLCAILLVVSSVFVVPFVRFAKLVDGAPLSAGRPLHAVVPLVLGFWICRARFSPRPGNWFIVAVIGLFGLLCVDIVNDVRVGALDAAIALHGVTAAALIPIFTDVVRPKLMLKPPFVISALIALLAVAYSGLVLTGRVGTRRLGTQSTNSMFLFVRSFRFESGVSPLMPLILVGGVALLLIGATLRRTALLKEGGCDGRRLNFGAQSFAGVKECENHIKEWLNCDPWRLSLGWLPWLVAAAWFAGVVPVFQDHSIEGRVYDLLIGFMSAIVIGYLLSGILRFVLVGHALKTLLVRLYGHPARQGFQLMYERVPGGHGVALMEYIPSLGAIDAAIGNAKYIVGSLPQLRLTGVALLYAEDRLRGTLKATSEGRRAEAVQERSGLERALSIVSYKVAKILERELDSTVKNRKLVEQSMLFVANRTLDLIRLVWPQLLNLADTFVIGAFLMLLAVNSYPFPMHQTLLRLAWVMVLVAVALMLFVVFSLNRDRVICLLTGRPPGKITLTGDLALRVTLYGIVPVLILLGASFPDTLQRIGTGLSTFFGLR